MLPRHTTQGVGSAITLKKIVRFGSGLSAYEIDWEEGPACPFAAVDFDGCQSAVDEHTSERERARDRGGGAALTALPALDRYCQNHGACDDSEGSLCGTSMMRWCSATVARGRGLRRWQHAP